MKVAYGQLARQSLQMREQLELGTWLPVGVKSRGPEHCHRPVGGTPRKLTAARRLVHPEDRSQRAPERYRIRQAPLRASAPRQRMRHPPRMPHLP